MKVLIGPRQYRLKRIDFRISAFFNLIGIPKLSPFESENQMKIVLVLLVP